MKDIPFQERDFQNPRKSLGQNFLHQRGVISSIIDAIRPGPEDVVVEIGPGRGALTFPLLDRVRQLHVVEIDTALAAHWDSVADKRSNLIVHRADVLSFDIEGEIGTRCRVRVVGNLPYNISSPILFHLLRQAEHIIDMHLMFQLEVARRLVSEPGSKQYGRLSVMVQQRCDVSKILRVAPGAFVPVPKVDSAVVRLVPLQQPAVPATDEDDFALLVRAAFSQRRKTLRNSLGGILEEAAIRQAGVAADNRAEQLGVEDFVALTQAYTAQKKV